VRRRRGDANGVGRGARVEHRLDPGDRRLLRVRRRPDALDQASRLLLRVASSSVHRQGSRTLLQPVGVGHKTLADYTHLVGRPLIEEINELAAELKGLKVLHLSATAFGGGVSEILYTLVPLMRDVGVDAEWQVIIGREEFFNATKLLHNALQGNPLDLSPSEWKTYEEYNEMNARELTGGWDVIIVHDPQP